jgi:hypothetical protein
MPALAGFFVSDSHLFTTEVTEKPEKWLAFAFLLSLCPLWLIHLFDSKVDWT